MRILIITENEEFYLPLALQAFLEVNSHEILGVVSARNPLLKGSFDTAVTFSKSFGLLPVIDKGFSLLKAKILNRFPRLNKTGRHFSIKKVCQQYGIYHILCDNINDQDFIGYISSLNLDLIACISPTQIFGQQLISVPKHGCINIHTAQLPKYRGLYPTYWAMANGEKEVGICIHYIESGIDTGKVLLRASETIPPNTSLDAMLLKTKISGARLLSQACQEISDETICATYAEGEGSYFSFPTKESYSTFKKKGFTLW